MSGSYHVEIKCLAFSKIIFHASRWSHLAVSGVLLGPKQDGTKENSNILVADAVPLFHQQTTLAPMFEAALSLIEKRCSAQQLEIVGYYQANESAKDVAPDFFAVKAAEKIAENCDSALLLMVDNQKLSVPLRCAPFILSQRTADGKWKSKEKDFFVENRTLVLTSQLLQRQVDQKIVDFDIHLDDITFDWINPEINELVLSCNA